MSGKDYYNHTTVYTDGVIAKGSNKNHPIKTPDKMIAFSYFISDHDGQWNYRDEKKLHLTVSDETTFGDLEKVIQNLDLRSEPKLDTFFKKCIEKREFISGDYDL